MWRFQQLRKFVLALSGASEDVLAHVPGERVKFESLGWAILITTCLAIISMWFALASALGINGVLAAPLALFWGLVVMGIDRWLITSMPVDGRRKFGVAVPRLLLAVLLGTLISIPLVLRIFQTEIDAQIAVMQPHVHHSHSILMRLNALGDLSSGNSAAATARFLVFLLFVVIGCLPVAVKLLQPPGNYEKVLSEVIRAELRDARNALWTYRQPTIAQPAPPLINETALRRIFKVTKDRRTSSSAQPKPETSVTTQAEPIFSFSDAAGEIGSDRQVEEEWVSVNAAIKRAYEVLGPPPLRTLSGSRDGK